MRKKLLKLTNYILIISITSAVIIPFAGQPMVAQAKTAAEIQQQINADKKNLNDIKNAMEDAMDQQDLLEEQISDMDSEIVNMMTSVDLKKSEIDTKSVEIENKTLDIGETQLEYDLMKEKEETQYTYMKERVRYYYENGNTSVLVTLLECDSFSDMLTRAETMSKIYEYDQKMFTKYKNTKNELNALKVQLELDKENLEITKQGLEQDKAALENQKVELDRLLAKMKQEKGNYEAKYQRYKQEAATATKKIQQEEKELQKLLAQQKKPSNAANGVYTVTNFDVSVIDNASGSDLGKKVAKYGCQFIGNPYVLGGTSLTGGADCSGFTYRIYQDFGHSLPRTSYEQRSAGTGVDYASAQPGDIICYDGHVGIYVGGGYIVHASSARTGIKVSKAGYRPILSVRRIL